MPALAVLPAILTKSLLLAVAAGFVAARFKNVSWKGLLAVVLFYQVVGTLAEWLMWVTCAWLCRTSGSVCRVCCCRLSVVTGYFVVSCKNKMLVWQRKIWLFALVATMLLTSCATASLTPSKGVGRVRQYDFYSAQLPDSFDGFRVAFATDFHYESRFTARRLPHLIHTLQLLDADVLLLGGDYCGRAGGNMDSLFNALSRIQMPYGTYAVMGNHERGEVDRQVRLAMQRTGVRLLEHQTDTLWKGTEFILLAGVRNPFDLKQNGVSPTLSLQPEDFVLLLTHTPDYVEDVDVSNTDLALAGHTHGGQVSLFKRWTPARFSKYGNRFLTGLKKNSRGIPVIISNGIGTSRKDVRLFTPSEVVLIVLHKE